MCIDSCLWVANRYVLYCVFDMLCCYFVKFFVRAYRKVYSLYLRLMVVTIFDKTSNICVIVVSYQYDVYVCCRRYVYCCILFCTQVIAC